jgi:hypothetical protein
MNTTIKNLSSRATPLLECDRRSNKPIGEGKRLVGFVIGENDIGLGLSEPLFALDALVKLAKSAPMMHEFLMESLYHLRLDRGARSYHDKVLALMDEIK